MTIDQWIDVVSLCIIAIGATSFTLLSLRLIQIYSKTKSLQIDQRHELMRRENELKLAIERIRYTDKTIEWLIKFVTDQSVLMFSQFIDSINIDKINKHILVTEIGNIAKAIRGAIISYKIDYENMIVSAEYIDKLIIDTTVYVIKKQFRDVMDDITDIDLRDVNH